jgi:predicted dehydrogenase
MRTFSKPSDIKIGVIGYGGAFNMGKVHLNEATAAGMAPAAVSDIDASRLAIAQQDFPGIRTFTSPARMLAESEADLIIIITPHNTHARLALQCLAAGKHVVCEKPFAITTAECDAMIAAARKRGLMVSTYHNRHWDGCIMHAVKAINAGAIGNIVRIEAHMGGWGNPGNWWRTSRSISGGILYDWGVHLLEYSLQLMRSDIIEVSGFSHTGFWAPSTAWKKDTNEDEAFATVRFKNGAWLTLCISNIDSRPKEGMLEITGTRGAYIMNHDSWTTITHEDGATVTRRGRNPQSEGRRYYRNVADHLTKGNKLVITPEWARRPIHILDLAGRSARQGRALRARYR